MDYGTAFYSSIVYVTKAIVFILILREVSFVLTQYWTLKNNQILGSIYLKQKPNRRTKDAAKDREE